MNAVDEQPELRYCNKEGFGAVHLAVMNDRLEILKKLLEYDRTLLCM